MSFERLIQRVVLSLSALAFGAVPSVTPRSELIPRRVVLAQPENYRVRLSPDGKSIAYLSSRRGVTNIVVFDIEKKAEPVVTRSGKNRIDFYFWQADSRHIVYADETGSRFGQLDVRSGSTRDLALPQGGSAKLISYQLEIPNTMLLSVKTANRPAEDAYRVDLRDGSSVLDTVNPGDADYFIADHQAQIRAAVASLPDGATEVRVRDSVESSWRVLTKSGPEATSRVVAFSPDNASLYVISEAEANAARLLKYSIESGAQTVLAADPQYDVTGLTFHPRSHALEAVAIEKERTQWTVLDRAADADFRRLHAAVDGDFDILSRDVANGRWLIAYTLSDGTTAFYLYDRPQKRLSRLLASQPELARYASASTRPVSFSARDGLRLHGYLTLPPGVPPRRLPLVVYVHGGPWGRFSWGATPEANWLASRSYAVLELDFRGSSGYGKRFLHAGDRQWGARMEQDIFDARNWAIQQGFADPARTALYGRSYGGYAALVAAQSIAPGFVCAVDIEGPTNLVTLVRAFPHHSITRGLFNRRVGNPDVDSDFLKSISPLFSPQPIRIPMLIGQGGKDNLVDQRETSTLVTAARSAGKSVTYVVFPEEGHQWQQPENRMRFYAAVESFLAANLGGRAEPAAPDEDIGPFLK